MSIQTATTSTAFRLTNRRLRAGLAGLALATTFLAAPGLAGAESVAPRNPVDITNPTPGDDPGPDTIDDFTNPEPECPAIECEIVNPEPEPECPAIECTITNPGPDGDDPENPGGTGPETTTPEGTPDGDVEVEVEVQPAVVDAPVQGTPTFTG